MRKYILGMSLLLLCNMSWAEVSDLTSALQGTYRACVGIDDDLAGMKKLAGINTAITGVGTGLGVGATAVGIAKAKTDKKTEKWQAVLDDLIERHAMNIKHERIVNDDVDAFFKEYQFNSVADVKRSINEAEEKSKKLGNWRTGLLASSTATNIAGALIANKNRVDDDLKAKIDDCVAAVHVLKNAINQAQVAGEDVSEAQDIYTACREYEYLDLSPIDKKARSAMFASTVGAVAGGVGTATSVMANTEKTREGDKKTEKNLNTAANVMAVGSTIASAGATVFNAAQISAIKKVATVSEKCTGLLQ